MVLKEDVAKLGFAGDIVNVKAGYARNWLYPEKKAVYATKINILKYKKDKVVQDDGLDTERERTREQIIKRLQSVNLIFKRHCNTSKPVTKSSVTAKNIVDMLEKQHGIIIGLARVVLPQELKSIGNHNVKIRVDDAIDDEVAAAKSKASEANDDKVTMDDSAKNNTENILLQFESERFETKTLQEKQHDEGRDVKASPQARTVNLKVVINRR